MHDSDHATAQLMLNLCTCGRLHFSYGPVTIHLKREEFLSFAEQIAQAVHYLRGTDTNLESDFQVRPPSSACH